MIPFGMNVWLLKTVSLHWKCFAMTLWESHSLLTIGHTGQISYKQIELWRGSTLTNQHCCATYHFSSLFSNCFFFLLEQVLLQSWHTSNHSFVVHRLSSLFFKHSRAAKNNSFSGESFQLSFRQAAFLYFFTHRSQRWKEPWHKLRKMQLTPALKIQLLKCSPMVLRMAKWATNIDFRSLQSQRIGEPAKSVA